jgi:hypothetical protein
MIDSIPEAVAVSLAPTLAVLATGLINWRAAKRAESSAKSAQKATAQAGLDAIKAQEQAAIAQKQATEAARQLIITARESDAKLDHIVEVGVATHKIVDGGRTVMMNLVATLAERIAKENPNDADAQLAAKNARREARAAADTAG